MFTIGIDPHEGSHLAAVLDEREQFLDELRVRADRHQRDRLLKFAATYVRAIAPRVNVSSYSFGIACTPRARSRRHHDEGLRQSESSSPTVPPPGAPVKGAPFGASLRDSLRRP
jgi:hypothetical protein